MENQINNLLTQEEIIDGEIWKEIKESPNYLISNKGRVFSLYFHRLRKPTIDKSGYYSVGIREKGKTYQKRINRLVAENFIPNPENKPIVNHIDSNRTNNNVENLEWCTYRENNLHSAKYGYGQHKNQKLNEEQRKQIKDLYYSNQYSKKELANKFNVHESTISRILRSSKKESINQIRNKGLSVETIKEIRRLFESGNYTQKELAEIYNVSRSCITKHTSGIKKLNQKKPKELDKRFNHFTNKEKEAIKLLYQTEKYSQRKLGKMFNTSPQTIRKIVNNIDTKYKQINRGIKVLNY